MAMKAQPQTVPSIPSAVRTLSAVGCQQARGGQQPEGAVAKARNGQPVGQAVVQPQQGQHQRAGGRFQPQPHRTAQPQRRAMPQPGQIVREAHAPEAERPEEGDEQPGGQQVLAAQQLRLGDAGRRPADAHRRHRARHEAQPAHRGRLGFLLRLLPVVERPEQRGH